jgi:hypothetical protein
VTAPGPPKAIGKGLLSNAFIAMLLTERYVAGRSQNSLVTGLARHGADISPTTLTGTCAAAGALLAPLVTSAKTCSTMAWPRCWPSAWKTNGESVKTAWYRQAGAACAAPERARAAAWRALDLVQVE